MTNPAAIMQRLEQIEVDLAEREHDFSRSAGDRARLSREVEYQQAKFYAEATGNTTDRRMRAQERIGATQEYRDLLAAEATYDACKAAIDVLKTRSSIGQTLLRTLREAA